MRWFLVGCVLLAPLALAASGGHVSSSAAPELVGSLAFGYAQGVAFTTDDRAAVSMVARNVSGAGELHEWRSLSAGNVRETTGGPTARPVAFEGATLRLDADDEFLYVLARALEGGEVALEGNGRTSARPSWLVEGYDPRGVEPLSPYAIPGIDVGAEAGWGTIRRIDLGEAGPLPPEAELVLRGRFLLEINGGNLTIERPDGGTEEIRLSDSVESSAGAADIRREARLILEIGNAEMRIPVGEEWLVAGPRPRWSIDGAASWPRASGTEGGTSFRDQPVRVEGAFALAPDPAGPAPTDPDSFALSGDYSLTAGGVTLTPEPYARPEAVAAWTLAGLAAAVLAWLGSPHLAGRLVAPLYTRIAVDEIATHPARSLICQHLASHPGAHLRDLHRRVGGAWGTFSFHLGMLRQAGVIRFERDGRYVAAYLSHQEVRRPAPRTPTAQLVLDAIPDDGSLLAVTQLRDRVGLSRQLLDHHLAALASQGLVRIEEGRPRRVTRTVPRAHT